MQQLSSLPPNPQAAPLQTAPHKGLWSQSGDGGRFQSLPSGTSVMKGYLLPPKLSLPQKELIEQRGALSRDVVPHPSSSADLLMPRKEQKK